MTPFIFVIPAKAGIHFAVILGFSRMNGLLLSQD